LYVIHFPVFLLFGHADMNQRARVVLEVAISFALAALSFRYLEQPLLRRRGSVAHPPPAPDGTPPELDLGPFGDGPSDQAGQLRLAESQPRSPST